MTQHYHDRAQSQSTQYLTTETPTHPGLMMHYSVLKGHEASIDVHQQKNA